MLTTRFPGTIDTILGDRGGWRSSLADRDIGVEIQSANSGILSFNGSGAPRDPQVYNGQRPTLQTQAVTGYMTIGLGRHGSDETRITVGGGYSVTTFDPNGPPTVYVSALNLYQSFFDKKVEVKIGFNENYLEYVGLFAGGNITLTTGLASLIPIQVGLSAGASPTPSVNVVLHGKGGAYLKAGIQRSINPLGLEREIRNRDYGISFSQKNARALYISEIGIKRDSSPDTRAMWLRAGYIENTSDYQKFLGGEDHNRAIYALADYQLSRPDPTLFYRGLYIGASAEAVPKNVNLFTRSGEFRAYYIGSLNARPADAVSFTLIYNQFSTDLFAVRKAAGLEMEHKQIGSVVAYAYHAGPGITITPGVQYIVHPTFLPGYRNAVLGSLGLYLSF